MVGADGAAPSTSDFCTGRVTVIGAVDPGTDTTPGAVAGPVAAADPLDEPDETTVLVSPAGRCDLGPTCDPENDTCGVAAFCQDDACNLDAGQCVLHTSIACTSDADCQRCILRQPATCLLAPSPDGCLATGASRTGRSSRV